MAWIEFRLVMRIGIFSTQSWVWSLKIGFAYSYFWSSKWNFQKYVSEKISLFDSSVSRSGLYLIGILPPVLLIQHGRIIFVNLVAPTPCGRPASCGTFVIFNFFDVSYRCRQYHSLQIVGVPFSTLTSYGTTSFSMWPYILAWSSVLPFFLSCFRRRSE